MRAVVQRVLESRVEVGGEVVGQIGRGLNVLLGVGHEDGPQDARSLAEKVAGLRVFDDAEGRMNHSVVDVGGEILAVSQFTLYGDCRRGRRPSFTEAAAGPEARRLYDLFCQVLRESGVVVREGIFQAEMKVSILNDGPVTLLLDSRRTF